MPSTLAPSRLRALLPSARGVRLVCTWFLLSRLAIYAVGVIGATTFLHQRTLTTAHHDAINPAVTWHQWDAPWYEHIALHGYTSAPDIPGPATAAFFPLYPVIVGALLTIVPGVSFFWMATIVSNVCSLLALLLMARIAESRGRIDAVERLLVVVLTAAGSFYLSIPYTEGLLLLLVVVTMVLSDCGRHGTSALAAGLGAVTKPQGAALIFLPVVGFLRRSRGSIELTRAAQLAVVVGIAAVPVVIYLIFLTRAAGSPMAFAEGQAFWDNTIPYPFKAVVGLVRFPAWLSGWLHGTVWVLYVGLLVRYWRRLSLEHALFCAGVLLVSTMQESFHGAYRYVVILVPLLFAIAEDDQPRVRTAVVAFNVVLGVIMILAFVTHNRLVV